jgi:hypothetical protein
MNRIILVGNGFDLAHGLNTSYKDFINYYLESVFKRFREQHFRYSDPLISIQSKHYHVLSLPKEITSDYNAYLDEFIKDYKDDYKVNISPLLELTRNNLIAKNWVDIEMDYFKTLSTAIRNHIVNVSMVMTINNQLEHMKNELVNFLNLNDDYISKINPDPELLNILNEPIVWNDISTTFNPSTRIDNSLRQYKENASKKPYSTMFVNFNYTSTLERYLNAIEKVDGNTTLNYIHGKLDSANNPPIFGFGDEFDKSYLEFEEYNENCLFDHVKSFRYFLTPNNKDLLRFVSSDLFQVYILGHSCGLTDRTMLRSIFENKNCKSIKIFHHKRPNDTNDYHEKTIELGRHFTDKGYMRRVIVDFDEKNVMPQPYLNYKK